MYAWIPYHKGTKEGHCGSAWLDHEGGYIFSFVYRSEANDLALRLARSYTGHKDVVVFDE